MSWRPDNWEEHKLQLEGREFSIYGSFEAGADAMLEALKKEGYYSRDWIDAAQMLKRINGKIEPNLKTEKGWMVFIPNEEK